MSGFSCSLYPIWEINSICLFQICHQPGWKWWTIQNIHACWKVDTCSGDNWEGEFPYFVEVESQFLLNSWIVTQKTKTEVLTFSVLSKIKHFTTSLHKVYHPFITKPFFIDVIAWLTISWPYNTVPKLIWCFYRTEAVLFWRHLITTFFF